MAYDCEDPCEVLDDPAWSPDGRSIAACRTEHANDDYSWTLVAVDVETGVETVLFTPGENQFCAGPRWSPDGTSMVLELVDLDDELEVFSLDLFDLMWLDARGLEHDVNPKRSRIATSERAGTRRGDHHCDAPVIPAVNAETALV
jgi:Tol biopolymer transport system component